MIRLFALVLLCLVSACGGDSHGGGRGGVSYAGLPKTHPDNLAVRHIVLLHPHSGERLDIDYYHDGAYDQTALEKINYLFRDRHANVIGKIDPELIDYMVDIRTRLDLPPDVTFEVLSGYRTPATNASLAISNANVAKESLHMHGWAVDFRIPHEDGRAICAVALTMQRGGVAYYPVDNHVHVDLGNIRTWHQK